MKIKCVVIRRFNKTDPGETIYAASQKVADSWVANGLVEVVKEKKQTTPKDKMVKGSIDK